MKLPLSLLFIFSALLGMEHDGHAPVPPVGYDCLYFSCDDLPPVHFDSSTVPVQEHAHQDTVAPLTATSSGAPINIPSTMAPPSTDSIATKTILATRAAAIARAKHVRFVPTARTVSSVQEHRPLRAKVIRKRPSKKTRPYGPGDFVCDQCNKKFAYRQGLQRHKALRGSFICFCGSSFTNKTAFKKHKNQEYIAEHPVKCSQCQQRFATSKDFEQHAKECKKNGPRFMIYDFFIDSAQHS